jgi:hypothetical protein
MSRWKGISHARTTRAMERALSPAEFKVVAVVRRLIPDGQRRPLSQAEIAAKASVSEGTVSRTMRKVDGLFFRRHFIGKGRGKGFEIEVIAPAEQPQAPAAALKKGSLTDPSLESIPSGVPMPQTAPEKGSLSDPCIFLDHGHEQQQQQTGQSAQTEPDSAEPTGQLAPETIAALTAAGAHPRLIARVARHNPACTPEDVAAATAAANLKATADPRWHTPPGLALDCLANAQRVIVPRPRSSAPDERPARPRGRRAAEQHDASTTDWAALQRAEDARTGAAPAPDPDPVEPAAPDDAALAEPSPAPAPDDLSRTLDDLARIVVQALDPPPSPREAQVVRQMLTESRDTNRIIRTIQRRRRSGARPPPQRPGLR